MRLTNIRVILSGSTIETYRYHDKQLVYDYTVPEEFRKKDKIVVTDEITEEKKIESRRKSMLRASSTLRRLINSNVWEWKKPNGMAYLPVFLTLTFREEVRIIKEANAIFSRFIKRLNYYINGSKKSFLKYVVVIEFQDLSRDGVVHYHVIFFNLQHVDKNILAEIWNQGFIQIKAIDNVSNAGAYVTKYMVKHFEDSRLDGQKRYFSSRKLIKPTDIKDEELANKIVATLPKELIVHEKEFEHEKRGRITYVQYKLKDNMTAFDIIPELSKLV